MKKEITILLDNIRSTHNVGSIFRTGDAAGVKRIFLSGITSAPLDRFGRPQKEIAKTALGAEKDIKWIYYKSPLPLIARLKKELSSSSEMRLNDCLALYAPDATR